jgi:hypothetical protein
MKSFLKAVTVLIAGFELAHTNTSAQTDGGARFEGALVHYSSANERHYTVAWVTTESGVFIKSLRKQGPSSWTTREWADHCSVWTTARKGSQVVDGYTSATAANYTGTNSPVIWTWNCRDAQNQLVADGVYKFWIQYAENAGQGPYTTNGLLWTKGPVRTTITYPDQRIKNMRVVWAPILPSRVTSIRVDGNNLVLSGQGPASKTFYLLSATNLSPATVQWTPLATNTYDRDGHFEVTNAINTNLGQSYFLLRSP